MKPFVSKRAALVSLAGLALLGCNPNTTAPQPETQAATATVPEYWPQITAEVVDPADLEQRIDDIMAGMSLENKIAQIIQPEIRDITVEDMRRYGFGSYLNGGGAFPNNDKHASVQDWVNLAEAMYQASVDDSLDGSTIPTMWGTDAVHGHNNVIGATLFPHNIGLGAARNPELITKIANATAREVMATGIDWIFAPTVAVARDDRWGRTYESYSEHPDVVKQYARAIVSGLQGDLTQGPIDDQHVISTVKHFLGDGGTEKGDDQGNNIADEKTLFDIHAQGYVSGLSAGAQTVMASFNSWHGDKIHGSRYLLNDVLKDRMGFDGFVVGDWNGHGQVAGCSNESCPQAFNAGLDVFMVPTSAWKPLMENTLAQVKDGTIGLARLDDAVRRVLRVKLRAGLFDKPSPANRPLSGDTSLIGHEQHREIARQAVRESLVLLKNHQGILPLSPKQRVLVAGSAAHNIGQQSGGWSITWQGTGNRNEDFPGATSIFSGIQAAVEAAGGTAVLSEDGSSEQTPDVAIVVFGEQPYAEGNGDLDNLEYQRGNKSDLALLQRLKSEGIPVVSVFISGRPLWVNPELNASDAFVAAWLPGTEGQGIADVLFTDAEGEVRHDFVGTLPFSWPATPNQGPLNTPDDGAALLPYGFGLRYGQPSTLALDLSEQTGQDAGLTSRDLLVGQVKAPWKLIASTAAQNVEMSSNTLTLEGFAARTMDRRIQEDALQLSWQAEDVVSFGLSTPFPEDLRGYLEAGSQLQFDVQWIAGNPEHVELSLQCMEACEWSVPLSALVTSTPQWQTVSIDMRCLASKGVDFGAIMSPFTLRASKGVELGLSDIRLQPNPTSAPSWQCSP
ncbi:exo 1,3/1,4-beta-D-glucan glucohydrolase [Aestuariibacter halophilus]|uniref:Exo 1,3/1,4-beta-D-glucan glucohydrolase n=1 Tax=Fluctibacter halophilus TaxID=226011 RepID=A0ABS8G7M6_9ALTE|nr:exo 1,3/1,4-beta-D-glucan glucohydrolase [Aestuariibacter halophilus]MCC2616592.1 exo 1,3/1,4-beta-D-glucan glucohydrolase [Aestuariibacter halophilus]